MHDIFIKKSSAETWSIMRRRNSRSLNEYSSLDAAKKALLAQSNNTNKFELLNVNSQYTFLRKADLIPGGKGDKFPLHKIPKDELELGMEVESEHSPRKDIQAEIVADHEAESYEMLGEAAYYKYLKQMEDQMKQDGERKIERE